MMPLILRRAQGHRPGDCFLDDNERWFWGVSFMQTHRKSYGIAESREGAMVAFKAELKEAAN